jgi:hypothetical protein
MVLYEDGRVVNLASNYAWACHGFEHGMHIWQGYLNDASLAEAASGFRLYHGLGVVKKYPGYRYPLDSFINLG